MKNTLNFNKEIIIEKGRTILKWVLEDHTPAHRGVRDLQGNIIDSPNKCLLLNSTDIETADNLDSLHDKAKSPDSLIPNGRKLSNGFYENYVDKNGKIYNVFLSKYTFEPLPIGFSEMQDLNILLVGEPNSGKTLLSCMLFEKLYNLLNFTTNSREFSYESAASTYDWKQKEYHYYNDLKLFNNNEFPEPTGENDKLQKYAMSITSKFNGTEINKILNFIDMPGEYLATIEDQVLNNSSDCLWFIFDGEQFLTNKNHTHACLNKYKRLIETFGILKKIPTFFVLTKFDQIKKILASDCMDENLKVFLKNNNHIKALPLNTFKNSCLVTSVHVPEFDTENYAQNSNFTKSLFETFYPAIFKKLNRYNCDFITVSSLSHIDSETNKIPCDNVPFAIDALLLGTLHRMGIY